MDPDLMWILIVGLSAICAFFAWWLTLQRRRHENTSIQPTELAFVSGECGFLTSAEADEESLIQVIEIEPQLNARPMEMPASVLAALESILQRSPAILQSGKQTVDRSLKVVFSKEVTQSLGSGDAKLVKDATGAFLAKARDARTGKFLETGKAVAKGGIKLAQVGAMTFQIASIATAQQHLGEINERLQTIEDGLKDVLFLLEQDKRSKIEASVIQLRQYYEAIKRGELCAGDFQSIRQKIEDMESECLAIAQTGKALVNEKRTELLKIEVKDWFARSDSAKTAKKLIDEISKAMKLVFLAHACRILACQVRGAIPNGQAFVKDRIAHAKTEVNATVQVLKNTKVDFLKRLQGLAKRDGNPFALCGVFDEDHLNTVAKAYCQVQEQALAAEGALQKQAKNAIECSGAFDKIIDGGMSIELVMKSSGEIQVLSAKPA